MDSFVKASRQSSGARPLRAVRWALMVGVCVLTLLGVGSYFAVEHWPFRYDNVKPLLQGVFSSNVEIDHFSRIYFPHPGFVARGIKLRRNSAPNLPPVGSAKELLIETNWIDMLMLRKEIRLVRVVGLHVVIPPVGSEANREDFPSGSSKDFGGPTTSVAEFQISNSTFDIMRTNGERYSFPIHEITMRHLLRGRAVSYVVDMRNARPSGRIQATGSFGPLLPKNLGGTQVSGSFRFSDGSLRGIGDLHGRLLASGQFSGALDAIRVDANGEADGFAVGKGRPVAIHGSAQATVNGLNADVVFHTIEANSGGTLVHAKGTLAGSPAVTELDLQMTKGRAEDILRPFLPDPVPLVGAASMRAHAHVDAAEHGAKFIQRLNMEGTFSVPAGELTSVSAEKGLTAFSDRARKPSQPNEGADASSAGGDVLSSLTAVASIREGLLSSQSVTFNIPGATAKMRGTFDLQDGKVHLLGNLRMQHNISHAVTGFKSLLLKPLIPFYRHRHAGAVVPIAVTGSPGHYKVSEDMLHQK